MWLHKFKLLLWKNWILVKRHPIAALFELTFPVVIVALFTYFRSIVDVQTHPEIHYKPFEPDQPTCYTGYIFLAKPIKKLGFAPNTQFYSQLVDAALKSRFKTNGFEDEEELNQWIRNTTISEPVVAITFEGDGILRNATEIPRKLIYTIRMPEEAASDVWMTDQLFYVSPSKIARLPASGLLPSEPPYVTSCFLQIQNSLDRAFIKKLKPDEKLPALKLQAFPYPSITEDIFMSAAAALFPLLFVICMMVPTKNVVKNITIERESQLKESMKMMGLTSSMHWISWFFKCFIMLIIPFTVNCVLMTTNLATDRAMLVNTNSFIVWIFFVSYILSVITLSFLIGVIFKKSSTAANVGSMIFFLTILPYTYFGQVFHSLPYFLKMLFAMFPNSNMGVSVLMLMNAEASRGGMHFSNLFKRDIDLKFSFGELLIYMDLGSLIQMLLTIYIERVFPGEVGIADPWYFIFTPFVKYMKKKMGYATLDNETVLTDRKLSNPDYEEEPELRAGIRILNLTKKFGDKCAVDRLCLNLYENQISVLLGHNGAGKTTTMSMLTGLYSPTSGTAFIDGKDIRTELDEARRSLGICCQHNVLFEELTVREHLVFFCSLKGIEDKGRVDLEIKKYSEVLGLEEKLNAESRTLSGGMKRRLSIAIALCGDAKIVILDEPTSGMDPEARRKLWDLLIVEKQGRTILLSTHFMDEADILGDRIAIMTEGRLRTVGSSFFLKKKFGAGYRLICVKRPGFQTTSILNVVNEYVPEATLESESQTEATFVISEDKLPLFEHIFKKLEDSSEELHISSFGCSLTTLEEVFLKLGIEAMDHRDEHDGRDDQHGINIDTDISVKIVGFQLILYHIQAVFLKRFHVMRRAWKGILYVALISIWLIFVIMNVPQINFGDIHKLKMSLKTYEETETIIQNDGSELVNSYKQLFTGKDHAEVITTDFSDYILDKSNESFSDVMQKYLVGVTLSKESVTAWFNSQPYHTIPLSLTLLNRALLKKSAGSDYDISVSIKPYVMPIEDSETHMAIFEDPRNMIFGLIVIFFLLTYWPVIFIGSYIKERESRAKLLMFISGINRFTYWCSSLLFDMFVFILICCFIIGMIGVYQRDHYATAEELGILVFISAFYGFSLLPFIYAFSYMFSKPSTGETYLSLVCLLLGILYGVYKIVQSITTNAFTKSLLSLLYWIGLMFAPFSLVDELVKLGFSFINRKSILSFDIDSGIGCNIILHVLSGALFLGFCLLKDHMFFEWVYYKFLNRPRMLPLLSQNLDEDVNAEIQKVKEMSQEQIKNSNLVLNGLTKYYGNFLAVNQLYLDVESCECFGLLGINGAGKTSTFKMMTGDELITAGDAYVRGFSLKNQLQKVHQLIGYTPQYDAIIPELTGSETLRIFSLIRGIPKYDIRENIHRMATELGFEEHLKKQLKAFSGGNKRKLSTCLALLSYPQLIFLDEPTTGIDPQAKRQLWNVISKTRNAGRAIVITSHSMEECENLCTKIGIMVNGQFKCLGSVQYLKNKYSKGFVLTIKMGRDDADLQIDIQNRVLEAFPAASLKEKYLDILTFHIDSTDLKWSQVFSACAEMKKTVHINDYALCQMSLEQVFLLFSKSGIYQNA